MKANEMKNSAPSQFLNSIKYWTPLTSQVDALEQTPAQNTSRKKIQFDLPNTHRATDGQTWRRKEKQRIANEHRQWKHTNMTEAQLKTDIMNGTIASACSDTGATSTAGKPSDPFEATNQKSTKVFHLPVGGTGTATKVSKLLLNVRAPANEVDIVPGLEQTLLSVSKFADAGYTAVYDKDEVNFYNSDTIRIERSSSTSRVSLPTNRPMASPPTTNHPQRKRRHSPTRFNLWTKVIQHKIHCNLHGARPIASQSLHRTPASSTHLTLPTLYPS